jgi:FkbM family methyltransferase
MIGPRLKNGVRTVLRKVNLDLRILSVEWHPGLQLAQALNAAEIDTVFDIGANEGQFATMIRSCGFKGRIVSFEPLASPHAALVRRAVDDEEWLVHPRTALGSFCGESTINVSANSLSSSILPILDLHTDAASGSEFVRTESTPVVSLDSVIDDYIDSKNRYLIKIDAQGYEWNILDGAEESLRAAAGVQCEMSVAPLYEGQYLWKEVLARLESLGFVLWNIQPGFCDPANGRTLQFDSLLLRQRQ